MMLKIPPMIMRIAAVAMLLGGVKDPSISILQFVYGLCPLGVVFWHLAEWMDEDLRKDVKVAASVPSSEETKEKES
jgi:hypothetical protein